MTQYAPIHSGTSRVSLARVAQAASAIDPQFTNTPQFESVWLSSHLGCRLLVKIEMLNPIGSFKARGAYFLTSKLVGRPHLVCATAGNFGQGVAYAAAARDLRCTVFTGSGASLAKVGRMRSFGAEVRLCGESLDEARNAARAFASESGALLVEDGREIAIAEGAGSIAIELLRWPRPVEAVVLPLGDGALLAGVGSWVKTHSPRTQVIGVCAAGAPAMQRCWRESRALSTMAPTTIAQGLAVQSPFPEAVADVCAVVDDVLLVEDEFLILGMRLAHQELGLVLEPSGAAGLAAIVRYPDRFRGAHVATVLTGGGSLTAEETRRWLGVEMPGSAAPT